jgi:hypothetical protein
MQLHWKLSNNCFEIYRVLRTVAGRPVSLSNQYVNRPSCEQERQQSCPLDYSARGRSTEFLTLCQQAYLGIAVTRQKNIQILHSAHAASLSSDTRGALLLLSRDRLMKVEIGFGVRELLDLFDLQAPVFVGNDVCDDDQFAVHLPE